MTIDGPLLTAEEENLEKFSPCTRALNSGRHFLRKSIKLLKAFKNSSSHCMNEELMYLQESVS